MQARLLPIVVVLLALPAVMGPGRCGFILDFTETLLITDVVRRVELGVDDGSVVGTMYAREAVLLKRHTFGFEPSIGTTSNATVDGVLELEARCKYAGNCRFDHMFELPLGVAMGISMADAEIQLGYLDSDIDVRFETGWFKGVRLACPNVVVAAEVGDVEIDFAAAPTSVAVEVGEGDVTILVPPGVYACDLKTASGAVTLAGVTCDAAAESVLGVQVQAGDIRVKEAAT